MPHTPHTRRLEEGGGMQHFRDALARVLRERAEFPVGALVTVLDAKVTRDTKNAKAVLSVLPSSMEEQVLQALQEYTADIKQGLGESLRLRRMPNLHWSFDHTEEHAAVIEEKIEELKERGEL